MVNQFFGFREPPFGVTPDPRYLYLGAGHREALASLIYGIEANRGFLALVAHPGMGKTTLLVHLLEKFRRSARTAFLFQTQCSSRELLWYLLAEFGIEGKKNVHVRMHAQFNHYLVEQSLAGKRVIVVIDEAQNLKPSVLETVRLLSNFETPRAKLLQIILAGQPELAAKLASPSLSQLRQRIASFSGLEPLAPQEVARFIDHRLNVAGYQGPPLFGDRAKAMIAALSEGIPRNINSLCFGALGLACGLRRKTIDTEIVHEVFSDLDLQRLGSHSQPVAVHRQSTVWSSQLADPELASSSPAPLQPAEASPALHRQSTVWSSQLADPEIASSSPAPLGPAEASPPPTEVVALSGTQRDLDGNNHDGDTASGPENHEATRPMFRKSIPLTLARVVAFAVLMFMVGSRATKVAAPAVEMANTSLLPNLADDPSPSMVKIADADAVRLAPAKAQPREVQNSTGGPAELPKQVDEVSTNQEIQLAAPVAKIAKPLSHPEKMAALGIVKRSDTEAARLPPAKTNREQVQNPVVDPAELWKRVGQGSVNAEISLADLYLEGSATVEQNCEQAHQLLVVASRTGSKVASGLLNGKYVERCH